MGLTTLTTNKFNNNMWLAVDWSEVIDTATNSSTIRYTLRVDAVSSGTWYYGNKIKLVIGAIKVYEYLGANRRELRKGDVLATGTTVIDHNADGTASMTISVEGAIYDMNVNCRGSATYTLEKIPLAAELTNYPYEFNDEATSIEISYVNNAGTALTKLEACVADRYGGSVLVPYREISRTGNKYTFTFTEAERKNLRRYVETGSHDLVRVYLKSTIGGEEYYRYSDTILLNLINHTPLLDPIVYNSGGSASWIGGDHIFVKNHNLIGFNVGATARKEGTIVETKITCGSLSSSASAGELLNVSSNKFVITAKDNRGNTVSTEVELEMLEYTELTINQDITPIVVGDNRGDVRLYVNGNFHNAKIGAAGNVCVMYCRCWEDGTEPGNWITIAPQFYDNTYVINHTIEGLDYQKQYWVECRAVDMVMEVYTAPYKVAFVPVFDWSKDDFAFNVPVSFNGSVMDDFVIEQGTNAMGSNGTWQWRKWKSGRAECWGRRNFGNVGFSTTWGNTLYRSEDFVQSYPYGLFAENPQVSITIDSATSTCLLATGGSIASANSTPTFHIIRPNTTTMSQVYINFYAIGRW